MSRILVPTRGADDWRALLADPDRHWRPNRSAWSLAHHWEGAAGHLPADVATALESAHDPHLATLEMLLAVPEHQTPLPGGGLPSQSDLFVLGRGDEGLVALVVEGKVTEPFGPDVAEWVAGAPELQRHAPDGAPAPQTNRQRRLAGLLTLLGLGPLPQGGRGIRYQLLHRTAAAVLEARRFRAAAAVMLVQSFDPAHAWFEDYAAFCALFGIEAERNTVGRAASLEGGLPLLVGWVSSAFPSAPQAREAALLANGPTPRTRSAAHPSRPTHAHTRCPTSPGAVTASFSTPCSMF